MDIDQFFESGNHKKKCKELYTFHYVENRSVKGKFEIILGYFEGKLGGFKKDKILLNYPHEDFLR